MNQTINKYNLIFISLLFISFLLLLNTANSFSISYDEAINYFYNFNELTILTQFSTSLFGQNNIALRLPFILIYLASVIFLYQLTKNYFKRKIDRLISIILFMSLPGVLSAALLVNTSILVIFSTILYLYLYNKSQKHNYILLVLFLFLDPSKLMQF